MSSDSEREAPKSGESLTISSGSHSFRGAHSTISGVVPAPRWASPWWLAFLGLAFAEVVALTVRVSRVPPEDDWATAAALVRSRFESSDAITVAPSWADPLLRLHLGDRISAKLAGRADLASFERLWVLSIRGQRAPEAPAREPDFRQVFGRVAVSRYDLGPSPVVLDLVDALPSASVDYTRRGERIPCELRDRVGGPSRGGLGFGPVPPRQRFVCDANRQGHWVGTTIIEDLSLAPRRCVLQRPQGPEPISVTYRDIHLGTRLVLHAGLDYHDERNETGVPVTLRVLIDGREVDRIVHRDGDGFARYEIDTQKHREGASARGELRLEVTAQDSRKRSFCWSATIQDARRKEAP